MKKLFKLLTVCTIVSLSFSSIVLADDHHDIINAPVEVVAE